MNDYSSQCALVYDNGLFLPFALKLAESFGRVLFFSPHETGFPLIEKCVIGDGFPAIERCNDIWEVKNEVDLFCFPDIQNSGLQLELENQGKRVWGSRKGDSYELSRKKFLQALADVGLDVPAHERVTGLSELRRVLSEADGERYVKISRYRGTMETWRHISMEQSQPILDDLATKLGPLQESVPFLVFEPIDAMVEVGADTYCVDGMFPSWQIHGIEHKDKSYIGTWQIASELPEAVRRVNEAFSPLLSAERYRNFWSTEIRVTDDDKAFFIDPTCRLGSPSGEAQLEMIGNLADVVFAGAAGELVEPERAHQFAVQAILNVKERNRWNVLEVPEKVQQWVKLKDAVMVDGVIGIKTDTDTAMGWVVGVGETLREAIDHVKATADALSGCVVDVDTQALALALQDVEKEEEAGIEFTPKEVPEPAAILES